MSQLIPDDQSQREDNLVKNTNVSGDLTFAPVQIGTQIETLIVESSFEKVTQRKLNKNSPFLGLKRFNFKDRDRFFGRDQLIARLFEAVNLSSLSFVLGASGSGKSSVVRAGLIPELKKSLESQTFYDFIFTPNQDPFDSLYRCLLSEEKDYNFSKSEAEIALEGKADTLTKVISALKKEEERWLIFVDQFEELFTICDNPDKRKNFIEGLVQITKSTDPSVKIILAMRSDFLEQFSFYPDLGVIANQNNIHLVTEMYPDELRQAIEQPAARHGVVFEEGLVEHIIKEVEGQKGYLPLLQYTLNLLWESECRTVGANGRPNIEDRTLNKKSYAALEGVRGALQKRVNEIYSNLNQDQQTTTKQIFLKLVNIVDTDSGSSRAVSRRAYRDEFVGEPVGKTLNRFINENLLVSSSEYSNRKELQASDSKRLKQSAIVEIAHEILLSSWDELKRWLEQEKEAIILQNWLDGETRRWQKIRLEDESKAQDELLKGSRLDQVVEFRNKDAFKNIGGLRPEENQFIDASVAWHDRLVELEQERKLKELQAEVALSTEKERSQIKDKALSEAQVTIADARKQKQKIIRQGLIVLAGITVVTIAASLAAVVASQKLIVAQKGTQLEQAGNSARRQFRAGELESLLSAMRSGQALKSLVKDSDHLQEYPTISPLSTLQYILDNIYEQNHFNSEQGPIKSASFNHDGQQVATGGVDGTVQLWNLSGKSLAKWETHQSAVNYLGFSPDGKQMVTAGVDGTVQIRNLSDNQLQKWIAHPEGGVNYLSISSDGKTITTAGGDGSIRLWNFSGRQLAQWKAVAGNDGVTGIAISPRGQQIVSSGDSDGTVKLWNLSGKQLSQFKATQNQPVLSVSFSPDGQRIATAGADGMGELWNLSGKQLVQLKGHQGWVISISFSPDGQHLVTTGADGTVRIWDLSGQEIAVLLGHQGSVWSASFSRDSQHLVSVGGDGTIRLWNLADKPVVRLQANQRDINSVIFNPKKPQIAAVGDDGMVRLWNIAGKPENAWEGRRSRLFSISISPDGQRLVVSGDNNRVRIWSISGEQGNLLEGHQGSVKAVSFSPNGQYIVTAGADGTARLWSVSGQEVSQLKGHQGEVTSAIFSPDSQLIATTGSDSTARLWNLAGEEQKKLLGHQGRVNSVSFTPDGQQIATTGADGTVRIWDITGKQKLEFYTYQTAVNSVRFSPDGQKIATAGADGTVRFWDRQGRQIFELQGTGNPFWSLDFSAGRYIAAAEGRGTVYLWHPENLDELLGRGCQWLKYYLDAHPETVEKLKSCRNR
jgi:WD40 repeat protein